LKEAREVAVVALVGGGGSPSVGSWLCMLSVTCWLISSGSLCSIMSMGN